MNQAELKYCASSLRHLLRLTNDIREGEDVSRLRAIFKDYDDDVHRDRFGTHPLINILDVCIELIHSVTLDRNLILAVFLSQVNPSDLSESDIRSQWNDDVCDLVRGLTKIRSLYANHAAVDSDNFRNLLLTFAEDIRVIIIMLAERTVVMRRINHHPDEEAVKEVAMEAGYLYAPLAHKLGLYKVKSELEDLSLKYTNRDVYSRIARKLNETKAARDAYIADFIKPVKQALEHAGLRFDIKGRTKSIYSIWNKMKKQGNDVDHIYDLFAIRIILDVEREREKSECWTAYSVITDMYTPNPARLKDWLSIPKSNGYESLHITVKGPDARWVEVQIRSRRMDEIAEKGIAAHWKYKGVKSQGDADAFMTNVREALESGVSDPLEMMETFKTNVYDKEVFVFTPRGDLYRLPSGATILDFAFTIHSKLGCSCTGGRVNDKVRKINFRLKSGDTVEILTSANQTPKLDWLNFAITSKARTKIRQSLNEAAQKEAELGRESLNRRLKNRKLEIEEPALMKLIKKLGFKTITDFYCAIARETLDPQTVINEYESQQVKQSESTTETRSAKEFTLQTSDEETSASGDAIVIGENVKGLNYKMARCCNPIYGDKVFGFISSGGVIKVHKSDCPNAMHMRERYPYRTITVRWSGRSGDQYAVTLRIVGVDDLGIITNISSIINKEKDVSLRNISIDSNDGLFQGFLTVGITDVGSLTSLIKKIKTIKGVKDVQRG